jgi:putative DNA-invertase from lambdoid prophage Rac
MPGEALRIALITGAAHGIGAAIAACEPAPTRAPHIRVNAPIYRPEISFAVGPDRHPTPSPTSAIVSRRCPSFGRPAGRVQLGQRAALYCRVSTADQSCARQERDLTSFARRAGYDVVGIFKETGSGVRLDRAERRKVMALAQAHQIDAVLVIELSRWGRSTTDLLATLKELEVRRVSVIALNGMAFDLGTPHGRMIATVLAGIAEFERELIQERIRSGIAAAKARGKKLGRQTGERPKSDRFAPRVLALAAKGRSYRLIGREVGLSKNTVADIVQRRRKLEGKS